jgi:hypothetical protein
MMKVLLTSGHNPLAALIRRLTREDASHVALRWNSWVLHSNLKGVQWSTFEDFTEKAEIIDSTDIVEDLPRLLTFSAQHAEHGKYDYGGFIYIGLRLALRLVGIHLPKKNLWSMTGMFMCTEFVSKYEFDEEDDLITPRQLFDKIKGTS